MDPHVVYVVVFPEEALLTERAGVTPLLVVHAANVPQHRMTLRKPVPTVRASVLGFGHDS